MAGKSLNKIFKYFRSNSGIRLLEDTSAHHVQRRRLLGSMIKSPLLAMDFWQKQIIPTLKLK